ncbi:hypothetical protein [Mongoliitalea daihaiensis]|uniref:hypothetical protein n=1 Tax=Mongoliitalea daihaiensis TaxID=2782006 RepID=UPI001F29820C|nr:hypothetical protein [Mongoliitalea daihaiensis]UJP64578.1 hypothetical protein IPZ59_17510 [Mongoliitalea daihaiensis]
MKQAINNWRLVILWTLTLGLAPFFPEPHILGKVRWILGGAKGMELLDWLDFIFHGIPWVLLIRLIVLKMTGKLKKQEVFTTPKNPM